MSIDPQNYPFFILAFLSIPVFLLVVWGMLLCLGSSKK